MTETRIVRTKAGVQHAAERVYEKTGRTRTRCGRVVFGEVIVRAELAEDPYPVTCSTCARKEIQADPGDARPWGEQQEQVNWLESRYDDAYGGDW